MEDCPARKYNSAPIAISNNIIAWAVGHTCTLAFRQQQELQRLNWFSWGDANCANAFDIKRCI
eukprot:4992471-Pleurochrysis_carterae.AAC.1